MTSIYKKALGTDFNRLHPQMQKKFGISSVSGYASISRGTMRDIWGGRAFMRPFFYLATKKHLTFPERGQNVPFQLENYAYVDSFGRETISWIRRFYFPNRVRCFDATMFYSEKSGSVKDYLGIYQDMLAHIDLHVMDNGGLLLRSGEQSMKKLGLRFRIPALFTGRASVMEWYDDETEQFHIEVKVENDRFGTLLGYKGTFTIEYVEMTREQYPAYATPVREGNWE